MSQTTSPTGVEHLADRITAGTERLLREATTDGSNDALAATAAELWDVVAEVDDLLERSISRICRMPSMCRRCRISSSWISFRTRSARRIWTRYLISARFGTPSNCANSGIPSISLISGRSCNNWRSELEDVVGSDTLESSGDSEAAKVREFVDDVKPTRRTRLCSRKRKARGGGSKRRHRQPFEIRGTLRVDAARPGYAGRNRSRTTRLRSRRYRTARSRRAFPRESRPCRRTSDRHRRCLAPYLRSPLEDGGSSAVSNRHESDPTTSPAAGEPPSRGSARKRDRLPSRHSTATALFPVQFGHRWRPRRSPPRATRTGRAGVPSSRGRARGLERRAVRNK